RLQGTLLFHQRIVDEQRGAVNLLSQPRGRRPEKIATPSSLLCVENAQGRGAADHLAPAAIVGPRAHSATTSPMFPMAARSKLLSDRASRLKKMVSHNKYGNKS